MKSKTCFILLLSLIIGFECLGVPSEDKVNNFVEWANERGVITEKVEPFVDPQHGGYGVRAKTIIRKGEEILRIPEKTLVIGRHSLNKIVQQIDEKGEQPFIPLGYTLQHIDQKSNQTNNDAHLISYFILFHIFVGDKLPLFPWIQLLPEEIHNTIHFNEVDLSQLIGSEVYDKTNVLKKQSKIFWEKVILPETDILMKELNFNDRSQWESFFTLEKWIWAMSIVSSRSAMVPRKGLVIAIYTDLFNHKSQPRDYAPIKKVEDNGDFVVISQRTYVPGSQVFLDYGTMPSSDLLLFYGIVDEQNRNEAVTFYFTLDQDDPLLSEKESLLASIGYPKALYLPIQQQPTDQVIFYTRLRVADQNDLDFFRNNLVDIVKKKISDRNEYEMYRYIHLVADALLRRYPTEIGEDELGLKSNDLPLHGRMAITVRLREKKLLVHVVQYCSSILAGRLYIDKKVDPNQVPVLPDSSKEILI